MPMQADVIIIGAGPGGYRAASHAAQHQLKVVIFEQGHVGGTCLNEGCIPTKAYARNAEALTLVRQAADFGISCGAPTFSLETACSRKDEVIGSLREGIETLLAHPNITLVRAEARFVDAHTVEACHGDDGDTAAAGERYTAPHIIVATGSVPKRLRVPGAELTIDSSDLLQLGRLPEHLCIIGAGVIGMEFASIFSAFGTKVTVVEFLKECLPAIDSDIAKRMRKALEKQGVEFCLQCGVTGVERKVESGEWKVESGERKVESGEWKVVTFQDKKGREQSVEADVVLMAVGRAPRVFDHFSRAGFDYDERSGIHVDDHCQTTVEGIYAIGDVNGRQMLAHAAEMQGIHVVNRILGHDDDIDLSIMPAAVFTSPEVAGVGKTEDQLKQEGTPYECRKAFHRANGKALAMGQAEGMLKLLSEPGAGRILGCHAFGAHSADLIQEASALMCRNTTVAQLRHIVHIHPTLSEILLAAAEA